MSSETADPTTIGDESGRVALRRRREARVDHVHEIPFNEEVEVTCSSCGETITVGIYGATERSYDSCWTWDCDAYHKFARDRGAETPAEDEPGATRQTTLVTDGGADQESNHVGPIVFADEDARRRLQQSGDVVTFRVSERTTGDTWWRKSRTGEKMGDCRVECIGAVDPSDRSILMAYYREAGFGSVSDWQDAIEDLNGELTEGYLYRVTSDERWAECESCHKYSPAVESFGQPDYVWLCPECRDETQWREPATDGGHRPPCEAVANMDPTPPDSAYDLERRVCPNCRLYFDVGASADKVFCSDACRRRHERDELIADGGVDREVLNDHVGDDPGPREDSELELDDHMACKECGLTLRWDAVFLYGFQRCPECYMDYHRKQVLRAYGTLDSLEAVPLQTIPDDAEDDDTQLVADGGTPDLPLSALETDGGAVCHEPTPADDADLPRTSAGTPLPELRFVDRFATGDDVFYAVTEENGVRLYRVTGETTIVRGLLAHDAVIHETADDGCVTTPSYNDKYGTIDLSHHMGGREASFRADRILDEPVITLAEVDRV